MGEQVPDHPVAERSVGDVLLDAVLEIEHTLVPQPHDEHRGERLRDRPDPVLGVGRRGLTVDAAPAGAPHDPAVAHDADRDEGARPSDCARATRASSA